MVLLGLQRAGMAMEPPGGSGSIAVNRCLTIARYPVGVNEMNAETRVIFGQRLKQERDRLGLSQAAIAERGGTKVRTYQDWERDIATVSAEFLARISAHGVDIEYVLTGRRSAEWIEALGPEARELLGDYEKASKEWRALLRGVAALAAKQ